MFKKNEKRNSKTPKMHLCRKMFCICAYALRIYIISGPTFDLDPLFRFLRVDELIPKTFNIAAAVARSVSDADARERLFIPIIDCLSGL